MLSSYEHLCFVQQLPEATLYESQAPYTSDYYRPGRNLLWQGVTVLTKFIYEHSFSSMEFEGFQGSFPSSQFWLDSEWPISNTVTHPKLQMVVICVTSLSYAAFKILPSPEQTSLMVLSF